MKELRDYQRRSVDAIMAWVKKSTDPCILEAACGAGKSLIIAEVARQLREISGKCVLCLAPSAELVLQNRQRYLETTGQPASVFSASAGSKCLRHDTIFGTPGTVKKATGRLVSRVCAVVVDEAHALTPTVRGIIHDLKRCNPRLRVIGLSASPYRLDSGYVFASWPDGTAVEDEQANEPYFARLVERVQAHELIGQGYLTPPVIGGVDDHYDTSTLELGRNGQYTAASQERAFEGHGRKTSKIIADIVERSQGRMGVMIFAATVRHAQECMASLPPDVSAIVTGKTKAGERKRIIADFKAQRIKYLVNVAVLCTGFDAEHVDVIALLRHTESASLMQQMIGRGLRIHPDKNDGCLILDYAENVKSHTPDGDLFNPQIMAPVALPSGDPIVAGCERCGHENKFPARHNPDGYELDSNGYWVDLDGARVQGDHGPMPGHHGRRCLGTMLVSGHMDRCSYRWTFRTCEECEAENDIAARYCSSCKAELVDPNEKLLLEFEQKKADPYQVQTDEVLSWRVKDTMSQAGNPMFRVEFVTQYNTVTSFYLYQQTVGKVFKEWKKFSDATDGGETMPKSITYYKDRASKFWRVVAYNEDTEMAPDVGPNNIPGTVPA